MRIALISDIHGHYGALEAVLIDIARQPIDATICLGDVATIGPQPKQVLSKLKQLECMCVLGNHDAALLQPEAASQYRIAPQLIWEQTQLWYVFTGPPALRLTWFWRQRLLRN